jgi:hypothetical protein
MAVVIIDDLNEVQDVFELMTYLARTLESGDVERLLKKGTITLTKGPGPSANQVADLVRLDLEEEECEVPGHREACSCVADASATDPRQGIIIDVERREGPVPYIPCIMQGLQASLSDCWACWSDVHRGAIAAADALTDFGVRR